MDIFQLVRQTDSIDELLHASNIEDINFTNQNRQNLLHAAASCNKPSIAIELIRRNIDANCQDTKGMTPLHYTTWNHSLEVASIILNNGGDLSIRDMHGNTALWYAVFHAMGKHYDLVELLMNAGADPVSKNLYGRSPYDFAVQIKDERLIQYMSRKVESGKQA